MQGKRTIIEFAKAEDAVDIGNISRKSIEHDLHWKYTPKHIRQLIQNKKKNVVVARDGEKLLGFGIMTYDEEQANLDLLAVKNTHRRRGIGVQIVTWLEKVAHTAGVFNIYVQVRKINKGAIEFYKKLDFQVIDEERGYYQGHETGVIMCKSLRLIDNDYIVNDLNARRTSIEKQDSKHYRVIDTVRDESGINRLKLIFIGEDGGYNFDSLVWEKYVSEEWLAQTTITQQEFDSTQTRKWISALHSFDSENNEAIIQVGEMDTPKNMSCWAIYSWRKWDLVKNKQLALLQTCKGPYDEYNGE